MNMKTAYKSIMAIVFVSLILFSGSISPAKVVSETSYIIVHAHNPEGVEIASIQGVDQNSVGIYDGDTLIGYGAHDVASHNQPITISSGSHTIKVIFNGITLEQEIDIDANETQILTFTFTRTEFNHKEFLNSIGLVSASRTYISGGYGIDVVDFYIDTRFPETFPCFGAAATLYTRNAIVNSLTYISFNINGDGISVNVGANNSVKYLPVKPPNDNYYAMNIGAYEGHWNGLAQFYLVNVPPLSSTTFRNWYIQKNGGDVNGKCHFVLWRGAVPVVDLVNSEDYSLLVMPEGANAAIELHAESYFYDYNGQIGQVLGNGVFTNDRVWVASVPYDLLGTGIKHEQPPVASFTYSPEKPMVGGNITFDASSSYDPDGTIEKYEWDFGDGKTGSGKIVTREYEKPGNYEVTLEVTDNDGLTDAASATVHVVREIKVVIHLVKDSGITEKNMTDWLNEADKVFGCSFKFVVDAVRQHNQYDNKQNDPNKINIWGVTETSVPQGYPPESKYVSERNGENEVRLTLGDGQKINIKPSTLAHELAHIFGFNHNDAKGDPNHIIYPDNSKNPATGKLESCNRKGTNFPPEDQAKARESNAAKKDTAAKKGRGKDEYDFIGDVSTEFVDLSWTEVWAELSSIGIPPWRLHFTLTVASFINVSCELGFLIESDNNTHTGIPTEGIDYYVGFNPAFNQTIFKRYDLDWTLLDPTGITYNFTYNDKDADIPPIITGIDFSLPLMLLDRRAGNIIRVRAMTKNGTFIDQAPDTGFITILLPNISVTNVTSAKTVVGSGYSTPINVTIHNQGGASETFNVTLYYANNPIETQTITLANQTLTTVTFTWNTTGVAKGNYTISAYAWPVQGETDTSDNIYIDGVVTIRKPPRILSFHCTPNSFSPNDDGRQDTTTIRATFSTTVNWILEIRNSSGTIMRSWNGTATFKWQSAMSQQAWNGTDEAGKIVPDGTYNATLTGKDSHGIPFEPKTISLIVDTIEPIISDVSDHPDPFNPHIGQTTTINYTLSEKCHVTIRIYDPAGRLIKILRATQPAGANSMTWDGKVQGLIVPDGEYRYEIHATDMAGNEATPAIGTITVAP